MKFFQVLGLAPYMSTRIVDSKLSVPIKFTTSSLFGLWNIIWAITQLVLLYMVVPAWMNNDYPGKSDMTEKIELLALILGNSGILIIWIILAFQRETFTKMLNRLVAVDSALQDLNEYEPFLSFYVYTFSLISFHVFLWSVIFATQSTDLFVVVMGIPGFEICMFIVQYTIVVKLVENRFRNINRALYRYGTKLSGHFEVRFSLARDASRSERNEGLSRLLILNRVHRNLYEVAREFGEFNSIPVLVSLAFLSYMFLYNTYYFVLALLINLPDSNIWVLVNATGWIGCAVVAISALANAVSSVKEEVFLRDFLIRCLT